jgi:hypothetical protein
VTKAAAGPREPSNALHRQADSVIPGLINAGDVKEAFESSVSELAAALGKRRGPRVFSEHAVRELTIQQANFLEDMGLEAINLARRSQADVVSAADVRTARHPGVRIRADGQPCLGHRGE